MTRRRIGYRRSLAILAMAAAAALYLSLRGGRGAPTLLDVELTWGTTAADSAETRHLPFEIPVAGAELLLLVDPWQERNPGDEHPARVRARILRPNGTHLVGVDFRLFVEERRTLLGRRRTWPQGDVAFRPDTTGRHVLQLQRVERTVRRARVRVEQRDAESGGR